jgi:S-adenosylmethionine hydrolase
MPVITLTTDWGRRDHYLAAFKGRLFSLIPGATVFDITHDVDPFDTLQASFVLQNCYDKFPEGSIHFIGISSAKSKAESQGYLLVKANSHYFIGYDNGIFFLTLGEIEKEIILLDIPKKTSVSTGIEKMLNVISEVSIGKALPTFGPSISNIIKVYHTQPAVNASDIRGTVIYIDSFDNVVLNITKDLFESVRKNRTFSVMLHRHEEHLFRNVNTNYDEAPEAEPVVLFNERGNMEIALNRAKAAGLLGLKLFDTVRIEFHENR